MSGTLTPRRARAQRTHRGFTLIEMLLATVLVAMIMALAYEGMRAAVRGTERGQAHIQAANELRAVHDFLRQRLAQAISHPIDGPGDHDAMTRAASFVFRGEQRRMQFLAPLPGYLTEGDAYLLTVELVERGGGKHLQLKYQLRSERYAPGAGQAKQGEPERLLDGIRDVRFAYLPGRQAGGFDDPARWLEQWQGQRSRQLPARVRIEIERSDGERVAWPPLVVAPGQPIQGG